LAKASDGNPHRQRLEPSQRSRSEIERAIGHIRFAKSAFDRCPGWVRNLAESQHQGDVFSHGEVILENAASGNPRCALAYFTRLPAAVEVAHPDGSANVGEPSKHGAQKHGLAGQRATNHCGY
jgi:hypothetical protein